MINLIFVLGVKLPISSFKYVLPCNTFVLSKKKVHSGEQNQDKEQAQDELVSSGSSYDLHSVLTTAA